ncbi:hypothetical protein AVEN_22270-1 [Araneus ventricosus]|uniref:Uncharacterized protein n=1 Tax=Araneus ventricosus TaxID=182803 RepID=A0A4Y2JDR8_ARAVE|nr:hypothetical protein AVEN_22270-1 [Araneus ventricosus]
MNIKNSLSNLYDLVGVQLLLWGEADILPRPQDSRAFKHTSFIHTSFIFSRSQSCNCLRYVSIFIDVADLKSLLNRWLPQSIFRHCIFIKKDVMVWTFEAVLPSPLFRWCILLSAKMR